LKGRRKFCIGDSKSSAKKRPNGHRPTPRQKGKRNNLDRTRQWEGRKGRPCGDEAPAWASQKKSRKTKMVPRSPALRKTGQRKDKRQKSPEEDSREGDTLQEGSEVPAQTKN